jgi:glycine hydroxymethyltransferase
VTGWFCDILGDLDNEVLLKRVRTQVLDMCKRFPVYV